MYGVFGLGRAGNHVGIFVFVFARRGKASVIHAVFVAIVKDCDIAGKTPFPGLIEFHHDALVLGAVERKGGPFELVDKEIIDEQLAAGSQINGVGRVCRARRNRQAH